MIKGKEFGFLTFTNETNEYSLKQDVCGTASSQDNKCQPIDNEIVSRIRAKHHTGSCLDWANECIEEPDRIVFKYKVETIREKLFHFLSTKNPFICQDWYGYLSHYKCYEFEYTGQKFVMDNYIDLRHCYPLNDPDNDYLLLSNEGQTLYIGSSGNPYIYEDSYMDNWMNWMVNLPKTIRSGVSK